MRKIARNHDMTSKTELNLSSSWRDILLYLTEGIRSLLLRSTLYHDFKKLPNDLDLKLI